MRVPSAPCAPDAAPATPPGLVRHAVETVRLALPVMLARSGTLAMITADVVMTGRYAAPELAFYGLGFMAHQVLFVLGLGALMGVTVLASQADGMGEPERSGTVWRVAMALAVVLGVAFALASLLGERFFGLVGQAPELAARGGTVMGAFALGLPALLMFVATALFLEGVSRPKPAMWLMVGANAVNVALNWLLIHDHAGTPFGSALPGLPGLAGLGATGAALATSLTRWGMALALAGYVLLMPGHARYGVRGALYYPLDMARKLLRLGAPLCVAQGLESASFLTVTIIAGWVGTQALAVFQIATNLFHIVFMLALGLATAASVRVGNAVGRADRGELARAGWAGAGLGLLGLGAIGVGFGLAPGPLAAIYTDDPAVLALGVPVLAITGLFLVVDGGQAIMAGALRGTGDIVVPSTMVVTGFWGVNVPLGYWLAVVQGWGVMGLLWGLIAGAGTATALLVLRFAQVSRREVHPV